MIILLPLEMKQQDQLRGLPLANLLLIALNVLSFVFLCLFGWSWPVGPGTGLLSLLLYGFSHAGFWHLLFNMWALWVFGNAVNRRLGNGYYLLGYLGTLLALGILARVFSSGPVLGASGAIFAVITIAAMLLPAARLVIGYVAVFPLSLLIGLFRKPKYGIYWFVCGGEFSARTFWCLIFIPILEILDVVCALLMGGSAWNLGHLLGMACGLAFVLLLPQRISMRTRAAGYSLAED